MLLIDVIRPTFFSKYVESGSKEHLQEMFNLLLKIGAFSVFPLAAGIFVLGDKMIIHVFKPDYLPAIHILWVLAAFTAVNIFFQVTGLVLKALEQIQDLVYSKLFGVYNLIAALLVVQRFGVMGVVLVTCSAVLMKNAFLYFRMIHHVPISVDWTGLLAIFINASLMALVLLPLRQFAESIVSLAMIALLGVGIYLLMSWLNKSFSAKERGWINQVAPKPVFVF